jgi:predicted metal-binding membrane protein
MPALGSRFSFGGWHASHRRRFPEWWVSLPVVVAWLALAVMHRHQVWWSPGSGAHHHAPSEPGLSRELGTWAVMTVAMMAPVTPPALRYVVLNSFPWRRNRALVIFLMSFVGVWLAFGFALIPAVWAVRDGLHVSGQWLTIAGLAVAVPWQMSGTKRRALIACGRAIPLRPEGRLADKSCAEYGLQQAWRCIKSCWALMFLMLTVAHGGFGFVWMIAISIFVAAEELHPQRLRLQQPSAATLAILLGVTLML